MSDPLLSKIDGTESQGVKYAKLQRWIKQACINAGLSTSSSDPLLKDLDGTESDGMKLAVIQRWQALLANNISGGTGVFVPYTGATSDVDLGGKNLKDFFISQTADATAKLALDVSSIATATTRTVTVPNRSLTLDNVTTATTSNLSGILSANGTNVSTASNATDYVAPSNISTGLTNTAGVVTANLSTGKAGSQSVVGGTAASETLTLSSTVHATKGKVIVGTSAYDEANNRLGVGTSTPTNQLSFTGQAGQTIWMERHSTSNTAGNNLTIQAGGATSGATDKAGGAVVFQQGASTGSATGTAFSWVANTTGTTGTSDQATATRMTMLNTGFLGINTTSPAALLSVDTNTGGVGTGLNLHNAATNSVSGRGSQILFTGTSAGNLAVIKAQTETTANNTGVLILQTSSGGTLGTRVYITSTGLVALGNYVPTKDLSFDGTAARNFGSERHTTNDTAGNSLTIQSGGATSGANNKSSGDLVIVPGVSTGLGKARINIKRSRRASSSGTGDNANGDGLIIPSDFNLTNNSANSLFDISLPTLNMCGGEISYTIVASDGTDMQSSKGIIRYASVNKGGVYTSTITEVGAISACSTGTLTSTWALTSGTNKVTAAVTPASSLTPTTMVIYFTIDNQSSQTITLL